MKLARTTRFFICTNAPDRAGQDYRQPRRLLIRPLGHNRPLLSQIRSRVR
jgi:hypothetical protein